MKDSALPPSRVPNRGTTIRRTGRSGKDILTLIGERGAGEKTAEHRGYTFHHTGICYEKLVRYRGDCETSIVVNRRLSKMVVPMIGRSDAVLTEDPDAMIFQFIMERRAMKAKPFLIVLIDCLRRTGNVNAWLRAAYGEDRLGRFLTNPLNCFLYTTRAQGDAYVGAGILKEQLHFLPTSVWLFETLFPAARNLFHAVDMPRLPRHMRWARDAILCPGCNNRDYETLSQALGAGGWPVHVVSDLVRNRPLNGGNIQWHDFLPMPDYARALGRARVVVVPTKPGNREAGGGQATIAMAMRLGKPIVASADPSTKEYIQHQKTGLLVEPGNPKELRAAVHHLVRHEWDARRLGENARGAEAQFSREARRVFDRVLDRLTS